MLLAEDEASVYLQATTQAGWASKGQTPVIAVHPGRELAHCYGPLNLLSGVEVAQMETVMNSAATARHLERLLSKFPEVPIVLYGDRAPWHRVAAVQQVLDAYPRLAVIFLPTAAPDLNPQEHIWKAARQAVSHNHDERKLHDLAERFVQHLNATTFDYAFVEKYDFESLCARFK